MKGDKRALDAAAFLGIVVVMGLVLLYQFG
jgi:hypothetical protein